MKVSILIGGLSGGGAERVVSNLSNYLSHNHEVTILTMTEDNPAYYINEKVSLKYLIKKNDKSNFIKKNLIRYRNLRRYILTEHSDVFIVFLPVTTNLLLSLRRLIKVPIIVSERGDPIYRYRTSITQRFFMKNLYKKADNFVFQTDDSMAFYKNEIGVVGEVIPNAINEEFIGKNRKNIFKKRIISVGRLNQQKNFELLIKSFSKVQPYFADYTLEILGDGPLREELTNLVKELNLDNVVSFPGYVNNVDERLSDSALFVLPSNYEGMPNALMEAMAIGLPCISTDCPIGGPRFLIEDGYNGFLVPVNDEVGLSNRIEKVLSDTKLQNKLGDNSQKIINKLNPDTIYASWEKLVLKTVNNY